MQCNETNEGGIVLDSAEQRIQDSGPTLPFSERSNLVEGT